MIRGEEQGSLLQEMALSQRILSHAVTVKVTRRYPGNMQVMRGEVQLLFKGLLMKNGCNRCNRVKNSVQSKCLLV